MKIISSDLKLTYPIWKEKEASQVERIYFKDLDVLKSNLKNKLEAKGRVHITIPEKYYNETESDIEKLICGKKHTVYVMGSRKKKLTCVKLINKDSFNNK